MPPNSWTSWPLRESLSREGVSGARLWLGRSVRIAVAAGLVWTTLVGPAFTGWRLMALCTGVAVTVLAFRGFFRATLAHHLWPSIGLFAVLVAAALGFAYVGARTPATVLWCACAVIAMERLPLSVAVPCSATALSGYAALNHDNWWATAATAVGLGLAGCVVRLDAEARGNTQRMLAQERAARKAESESAALTERGRIAREIHDVLAHSLSAQLVHLEAARLLIQRSTDLEADRAQLLERVTACRGMAREGLDGTREALSALRGEMIPVEDFLRRLTATEGARLDVAGAARAVPAEAGLAVRRVAQEALTNVRKHAPGARVSVRLEYAADGIGLEVRDSGGRGTPGELAESGSGYGLLGMRERAELLGGTLESGPDEEGFVVRLRVPA
ncbi:signal transduction histidine kinase [Streptomyces sp. 2333.5]|uniref:sensor histidine kinase n=1 Tax=Streptomyces TaxID=1883 RepID=UPI00089CFC97|nr:MULTISPECIES: histidine kinase [unclassified Streptomyces]PJJ04921.1 signal transduction histidine kinase [Streptomyces sp. 2333.5]SEE90488.1 Signal transduction histidine kinase [Streptomyces sp. 2112.2]